MAGMMALKKYEVLLILIKWTAKVHVMALSTLSESFSGVHQGKDCLYEPDATCMDKLKLIERAVKSGLLAFSSFPFLSNQPVTVRLSFY